jgi:signal transduction histidine kinase
MTKGHSIRRYFIGVQVIVVLVVILSYTFLLNWFFTRGLDEANYLDMYQELTHYTQAYDLGQKPDLPNSVHFKGYIGWSQLPDEVKKQFPSSQYITQLEMEKSVVKYKGKIIGEPKQVNFMVTQPLNNGQIFYLIRSINANNQSYIIKDRIKNTFLSTAPIAITFVLLILITIFLVFRKISYPIQKLSSWLAHLDTKELAQPRPNFGFIELNEIAEQHYLALSKIRNLLDKEQDFLRHASHELRTPIAIIKSNSELLKRILNEGKGSTSVERIERASLTMQHMINTLLWLNREDENEPEKVDISIASMVKQVIEENKYLLQHKQVTINLELDFMKQKLTRIPCYIVLSNLIRNAFQYTDEGEVTVFYHHKILMIKNISHSKIDSTIEIPTIDYGYGYGFGLQLVNQIIEKMAWGYKNEECIGGRRVLLSFP